MERLRGVVRVGGDDELAGLQDLVQEATGDRRGDGLARGLGLGAMDSALGAALAGRPRWWPAVGCRAAAAADRRRRGRRPRRAGTVVLAGTCISSFSVRLRCRGRRPRALCPGSGVSSRCGLVGIAPAGSSPASSRRKPSSSSTVTPRSVALASFEPAPGPGDEVVASSSRPSPPACRPRPGRLLGLLAAEPLERPGHDDGLARERPVLVRLAGLARPRALRARRRPRPARAARRGRLVGEPAAHRRGHRRADARDLLERLGLLDRDPAQLRLDRGEPRVASTPVAGRGAGPYALGRHPAREPAGEVDGRRLADLRDARGR